MNATHFDMELAKDMLEALAPETKAARDALERLRPEVP